MGLVQRLPSYAPASGKLSTHGQVSDNPYQLRTQKAAESLPLLTAASCEPDARGRALSPLDFITDILLVERVYATHLLDWICTTAADF